MTRPPTSPPAQRSPRPATGASRPVATGVRISGPHFTVWDEDPREAEDWSVQLDLHHGAQNPNAPNR